MASKSARYQASMLKERQLHGKMSVEPAKSDTQQFANLPEVENCELWLCKKGEEPTNMINARAATLKLEYVSHTTSFLRAPSNRPLLLPHPPTLQSVQLHCLRHSTYIPLPRALKAMLRVSVVELLVSPAPPPMPLVCLLMQDLCSL